mmetsp:Transcript_10120/g.25327  ORF Transcript_10120/g.25327 Transcript_10120/m.25327 type:complete len:200 (-) Transcript_10120:619-1218(-)
MPPWSSRIQSAWRVFCGIPIHPHQTRPGRIGAVDVCRLDVRSREERHCGHHVHNCHGRQPRAWGRMGRFPSWLQIGGVRAQRHSAGAHCGNRERRGARGGCGCQLRRHHAEVRPGRRHERLASDIRHSVGGVRGHPRLGDARVLHHGGRGGRPTGGHGRTAYARVHAGGRGRVLGRSVCVPAACGGQGGRAAPAHCGSV